MILRTYIHRYTPVICMGIHQYTPVYTSIPKYWYTPIYTGILMYTPAYAGIYFTQTIS